MLRYLRDQLARREEEKDRGRGSEGEDEEEGDLKEGGKLCTRRIMRGKCIHPKQPVIFIERKKRCAHAHLHVLS